MAPLSAELTAYLERLVHPARKAFATTYAEHLLTGSTKPKTPKGLDAETAAKIARKVKRYAASSAPAKVAPRTPSAAPADLPEGLQHLPDAVRAYAAENGDAELLGLVEAFVPGGEVTPAPSGVSERLSDYYTPDTVPAFVETAEVDVLDLTDLEPALARAFALKIARWNGGGKVYNYRAGRRYLSRTVRRIDLNDPTVQALPNYEDLRAVVGERGVARA